MFAIVQGTARRVRLNVTNSLGYFLIKFTNPYNQDEVLAVFQNLGSTLKPIILITDSGGYGTPNPLDGEVNLNVVGNWDAKIYSQSSAINLNVDLATNLLSTTTVFVQGNTRCVTAPRNAHLIKTCQDVKDCLGISSSGSATKYLNEQGDFVTVSSTGGSGSEVTNASDLGALGLNSNWINPLSASDNYYWKMTLNIPSGYNEHDYAVVINANNDVYKCEYIKISGVLTWVRKILEYSEPQS